MTTFSDTANKIMMVGLTFIIAGVVMFVIYMFNMDTKIFLNIGASLIGIGCMVGTVSCCCD